MKTLTEEHESSSSAASFIGAELLDSNKLSISSKDSSSNEPAFNDPFGSVSKGYSLKLAARLNAASISEEEHRKFLSERQNLLDKKFNGTITSKESNRLAYVRWSLDRIEDAKYGGALDALEDSVSKYERFQDDIRGLFSELDRLSRVRRR